MKVSEIMSSRIVCIEQNEPVSAAAKLLKRCNIGALPVCDAQNHLRGMLTDRDIVLRCVAAETDPREVRVREIMSRGILTVGPEEELSHAVKLMSTDQVRRLPVVDDGELVGVVTLCDMARAERCSMEAGEALSEISANFRRK